MAIIFALICRKRGFDDEEYIDEKDELMDELGERYHLTHGDDRIDTSYFSVMEEIVSSRVIK